MTSQNWTESNKSSRKNKKSHNKIFICLFITKSRTTALSKYCSCIYNLLLSLKKVKSNGLQQCSEEDKVKSQNKIVELGRDLWRASSSTSLLKQGSLQHITQNCAQTAFEYLHRIHQLSGQPVPVLRHPHSKEFFPQDQTEVPVL